MAKKSFPIYINSQYRKLVDLIVADAKRISPESPHFTPQWSPKGRYFGESSFEASSDDIIKLLADIYIYGDSSIFEKSVMYEFAKQAIIALELRAIK